MIKFDWVNVLFNKYKFVRRFVIFWCMGLITFITVNNPDMDSTNFTAVIGLMTVVVGLYQWDKNQDRNNGD